jgi:hypothetical protein
MDTRQILTILKQKIGHHSSVAPSDRLPTVCSKPYVLVVNTDPSDKPGTHWVAIFINTDGTAEYFDSYGFKPNVSTISKFLQRFKHCRYNKKRIQGLFSSVCGHYCIYFVLHRWNQVPMEEILNRFSEDCEENDSMITEWVNENFQLDTDTYDIDFLFNQICCALK